VVGLERHPGEVGEDVVLGAEDVLAALAVSS
jgi:hypothetical protein